jgi:ATP-dependent helicase/DNAse subunit B
MTAGVHILCGPAGTGKSRRLRAECVSACGHGPGTVLWLAPSLRRAEELRGLLPATSLWLGTFQELADQLVAACEPESRPLSRVQRRLVLDAIVSELHERGQLSHFARVADTRGFADGVAAVLEELARHDVSPDEFLRAAALRPGTAGPVEEAHGGQPMHAKDRQLSRLHTRYRQHLQAHGLLDPDGRLARARDLLGQGRRGPFDRVRAVFLDDFADLTTPQIELVTLLASFCEHVWLSLPLEPGERAELFAPSRSTLARLEPLQPQVEWFEASREGETGLSSPSPSMGEGWGGGEGCLPPTPTLPHEGGELGALQTFRAAEAPASQPVLHAAWKL